MNDFAIIEPIVGGQGQGRPVRKGVFGPTSKAIRQADGAMLAMKQLKIQHLFSISQSKQEFAMKELEIIQRDIKHESLDVPVAHVAGREQLYVLSNIIDKAECLADVVARRNRAEPYGEDLIVAWTVQLASALNCLHSVAPNPISHCNVKPSNIYVADSGRRIILTTFGCVPWMNRMDKTADRNLLYYPPEYFEFESPWPPAFDIWSLGVVIYEMCSFVLPFEDSKTIKGTVVSKKTAPTIPETYGNGLRLQVAQMLDRKVENRPTASDLENNSLFANAANKGEVLGLKRVRAVRNLTYADRERIAAILFENNLSTDNLVEMDSYQLNNLLKQQAPEFIGSKIEVLLDKLRIEYAERKEADFLRGSSIVQAIIENNVELVEKLIGFNASILTESNLDEENSTPLHFAVKFNSPKIVACLLEAEAPIDSLNSRKETPFLQAVRFGLVDIVQLFLNHTGGSSCLNHVMQDNTDQSALHIAVINDQLKTAKFLLNKHYFDALKVCRNFQGKSQLTALHVASLLGKTAFIKLLVKWNDGSLLELRDSDGETPLLCSMRCGDHTAPFRILVKKHSDKRAVATKSGFNALHIASSLGACTLVDLLVREYNFKVDAKTTSNDDPLTALQLAVLGGHAALVRLLLVDLKANGRVKDKPHSNTLVHVAAQLRHVDVLNELLLLEVSSDKRNKQGRTPLHLVAASHGDVEIARILVGPKGRADLKLKTFADDNNEVTAFYLALINHNFNVAKFLLDKSRDDALRQQNSNGDPPLHFFADKGDLEVVKFLSENGAGVNSFDAKGQTPLHRCAVTNRAEVCRYLLERGADYETTVSGSPQGALPLLLASENGSSEVSEILYQKSLEKINSASKDQSLKKPSRLPKIQPRLSSGAKVSPDSKSSVLLSAVKGGDLETFKRVVKSLCPDDRSYSDLLGNPLEGMIGRNTLHLAAVYDKPEIAQYILQNDVNVDSTSAIEDHCRTALHLAALAGSLQVASVLIDAGANVAFQDANRNQPLHLACLAGHFKTAQLLIENGSGVTAKGFNLKTPLHNACFWIGNETFSGNSSSFAFCEMLERETRLMEVSAIENEQCTLIPVKPESLDDKTKIIEILLQISPMLAMINDSNDDLPIHHAARTANLEALKVLAVRSKQSINAEGDQGFTALHLAVIGQHVDVVKFLIEEAHADVDAQSGSKKQTAVHLIFDEDYPSRNAKKILEMLLKAGANVNLRNDDRKRPLQLAMQKFDQDTKWLEFIKILADHGATADVTRSEGAFPPLLRAVLSEPNFLREDDEFAKLKPIRRLRSPRDEKFSLPAVGTWKNQKPQPLLRRSYSPMLTRLKRE